MVYVPRLPEVTGLEATLLPEDPDEYPIAFLWRRTPLQAWHLVVWSSPDQEEALDVPLGQCTCHNFYECPAGTQHLMARNILAGILL